MLLKFVLCLIVFVGFVGLGESCARMSSPSRGIVPTSTPQSSDPVTTVATTSNPVTTTADPETTASTATMSTTTQSNPCVAPTNTVGLTIDEGTAVTTGTTYQETPAVSHCTSCDSGDRNFYTSATTTDPIEAGELEETAISVECQPLENLCVCNSATGVCCRPLTTAEGPDRATFIPYCDSTGCYMNVIMQGDQDTKLTCTDNTVHTFGNQLDANGPNGFQPMNTGAYFQADSVSCSGCTAIEDNVCMGPPLNGPAQL